MVRAVVSWRVDRITDFCDINEPNIYCSYCVGRDLAPIVPLLPYLYAALWLKELTYHVSHFPATKMLRSVIRRVFMLQ